MAKPSPAHAGNQTLVDLGAAIRKTRKKLGLSQEALAIDAGLDRSYMGGIERGEHNISVVNMQKIADALCLKISKLFEKADL